jgi:antitoxin YefM
LRALLDEVTATREPVFIRRKGREDVAVLPADELRGLLETAYLLRSPANAARLEDAAAELDAGGGERLSVADLRRRFGLDAQ